MNTISLVTLGIAVVNAPSVRLRLGARAAGVRSRAALGGGVVAMVAAVLLGLVAHPLIDGLDVAPETFRVAAAMIVTLSGLVVIASPAPSPEHLSGRRSDFLVPVAYPLLLGPGPVLAWLVVGVDHGVWRTAVAAGLGSAVAVICAGLPEGRRSGWVGAARLLAAVVVVLGVAMVIDGVREV